MAKGPRDFHFDGVIRADQSQAEVFDVVGKPIANAVLEGFNGTVFAYGQTGKRVGVELVAPPGQVLRPTLRLKATGRAGAAIHSTATSCAASFRGS